MPVIIDSMPPIYTTKELVSVAHHVDSCCITPSATGNIIKIQIMTVKLHCVDITELSMPSVNNIKKKRTDHSGAAGNVPMASG